MGELRLTTLTTHTIRGELYEVPLDEVMAIGAGLTAAAAVGLGAIAAARASKTALQEAASATPQDRLNMVKTFLEGLGPEAQAKLIESIDIAGIVQEALVAGSILPDEVG